MKTGTMKWWTEGGQKVEESKHKGVQCCCCGTGGRVPTGDRVSRIKQRRVGDSYVVPSRSLFSTFFIDLRQSSILAEVS